MVPAREAVAETQLQRVIQEAGAAAVATVFDTAEAYDDVLYGAALLDLEGRLLQLQRAANERQASTPRGRRNARSGSFGRPPRAQRSPIRRSRWCRRNARSPGLVIGSSRP